MDRPEVSDEQTLAECIAELDLKEYDKICVLLPTAVFVTVENLKNLYKELENYDSACFVVKSKDEHPTWGRDIKGKLFFTYYEHETLRDAGQCYFIETESFKKYKSLLSNNHEVLHLSSIDINTMEDWTNAEQQYSRLLEG